ncbi:hypothetical protein Bca52824_086623 [Brassica carinata]|uniref:Uncharacterized protein n=1 Tax=Brassica carinata TaxID=52824 RepID=A0A8X7P9E1_BRACI|nr:hypothetical protein Bca52824_086623 [Brassica carinata]
MSSICLITNVPHFLASQVTEFCALEKGELIETGSGCDLTSVGVVRYRVELCISDGTESAVFVVFYAEISWLTNGVGVGDSSPHSNICDSCKPYFEIYTPPYIHEAGPSAAEATSDELNSGRIIADEQQLPGAGCPLKKARTE